MDINVGSSGVRRKGRMMETSDKIAGIDGHKSMRAVVIADAAREGEFRFARRKFGTMASMTFQ